ncbi:O-acetyltransferase OatA [Legionella massiliensis]|uniref:O-acetyltransferase OatA n=1 Tax=Legionella massiliensis TaxID=1034943 RepID=A0A078KYJ8_9GAMM|nr:acyltransferase family protein [Legionella massiliensis]CDZ78001.1 O-acetyltransferase OatA [Legionella massiliensis]CEE13739.1 O-acetyltransferase OatA [Legionella massiliensis]
MKYRPHVDGLRAIAILFVLVFHAGLTLFPSGFIGVDIFFVISGFLITGIIHKSLQNNSFSFVEFYNRRLWRLQPLFICLIVVTTLLTLLFYIPEDLVSFGKSARKTSLFLSNQYFERVTKGYFSEKADFLPLLHTWSLSIEWQCYLILPIVIYLLHRLVGNRYISKVIYLLTAALFALSLHYSAIMPEKTYYLFLSRIFEFFIGSCTALAPRRINWNKYLVNLVSIAALLSLFYVARLSNISLGFPNWYTLGLCIAVAILIRSGEYDSQPLSVYLLSLKPIVFIGLLSYSLYIWHWPVFVTIRYLNFEETSTVLILAFVLIIITAYLSWRFIEKPARKLNNTRFVYTFASLLLLPALLFHFSDYEIKKYQGYPQRFEDTTRIYTLLNKYSTSLRPYCLRNLEKANTEIRNDCLLGANNSDSRKGFMIGDSFSNHHWQFMDSFAKDANLSVLAHSTAGCLALPGIAQYDWLEGLNGVYQSCYDQNSLYYKMIKENHYDFVIIGQNWAGYLAPKIINNVDDERSVELSKERIEKAVDQALQLIIDSGARPVFIKSIALPSLDDNPHDCFFKHIKRRVAYKPEQCDFNFDPKRDEWFDQLFAEMQKKYSQLIIIDPRKVQCIKGVCKVDINGVPVFRDLTHLTDYASHSYAKSYLKRYKNPLVGEQPG